MAIQIIKDPVTGNSYSRDNAIANSTFSPYTAPIVPPPPVAPEPKIGDVYKGTGSFVAPAAPVDEYAERQSYLDKNPIDENTIRNNTLNLFQGEIDATNRIYSDMLREAQIQGQSKIGSGRAINARSGLLGSDFGNAQHDNIVSANTAIENSTRDQQQASLAAIFGKGRKEAADEIAAKRAAQKEGLDAYLAHISGKEERKKSSLSGLATSLLAQGFTPETVGESTLSDLAKTYGVSTGDILTAYKTAKDAKDKEAAALKLEQAKTQSEIDKNNFFELGEGQSRYVYDPITGKATLVANQPKTYAPSRSPSPSPSRTPTQPVIDSRILDVNGKPIKLTAPQVETISGFKNVAQSANDALSLIEKGVQTGPIESGKLSFGKLTGNANPDQLELDQKLSLLKSNFMKALSGSTVSEQEVARLSKFLPDMGDQESVIRSKLNTLMAETQKAQGNYLSTLGARTNTGTNTDTTNADSLRSKYNY